VAYYLQLKRIFFIVGLLLIAANADAETSIRTLREHGESMNLQMVTLRGVVHLTSHQKQGLGGTCTGFSFDLEDETGSIEIVVRRSHRLEEPLKEGDRVKVEAHVDVVRNKNQAFLRTCVMAREIEHLER
jgi:DNA/RNA endonuclease YhcR with UshA esterase domain